MQVSQYPFKGHVPLGKQQETVEEGNGFFASPFASSVHAFRRSLHVIHTH